MMIDDKLYAKRYEFKCWQNHESKYTIWFYVKWFITELHNSWTLNSNLVEFVINETLSSHNGLNYMDKRKGKAVCA